MPTVESSRLAKYICFNLDDENYALPIDEVREIILVPRITRVINVDPFVLGIINLRGEIVAILDLSHFLGKSRHAAGEANRVIIAESGGICAGLMTDSVAAVRMIDSEQVGPVPLTIENARSAYIRGVVQTEDRPLSVLSLSAIFAADEVRRLRGERIN